MKNMLILGGLALLGTVIGVAAKGYMDSRAAASATTTTTTTS